MKREFMRLGFLFLLMIVFTSSKENVSNVKCLAIPVASGTICCADNDQQVAEHDLVMPVAGFIFLQ